MPRWKILFYFFLLFLAADPRLFAAEGDIEQIFFDANRAYQESGYALALDKYESILELGYESGPLYYNIGNVYYRLGDYARALLNYERAKKWIPNDEDLFANRQMTLKILKDANLEPEKTWYENIYLSLRDALSAVKWFYLATVGYFVFFGILILTFFNPKFRQKQGAIIVYAGLIVLFIVGLASAKILHSERYREGLIIAKKAFVRYSPSVRGSVALEVSAGSKAQIIREQEDWLYIRFHRGKSGWVEREVLEEI